MFSPGQLNENRCVVDDVTADLIGAQGAIGEIEDRFVSDESGHCLEAQTSEHI